MPQQMYVVNGLKNNLLGLPAMTALGMLSRLYAISDLKTAIIEEFPLLFSGLGCFKEQYEINLKDGAVPHALFVYSQTCANTFTPGSSAGITKDGKIW